MPVETAADRAAMFSAAEFADACTYTRAAGGSVAVTAIIDLPDEISDGGFSGIVSTHAKAELPVVQLGGIEWAEGDGLTRLSDARAWTVKQGRLDASGAVLRLDLRPA